MASFHDGRAATRRRLKAFTLIELLVVVAIIALLVTMVMPTIGRAKELARQAVCLSNQRNIAQALQAYHTQYDYFPYNYAYKYPPYSNWGPNGEPRYLSRWALGCIGEILGGPRGQTDLRGLEEGEFPDAYICPAANLDAVYSANDNDRYHACYWTNICIRVNAGLWDTMGNFALMSPSNATLPRSAYNAGDNTGKFGYGAGEARLWGKMCSNTGGSHFRHMYCPKLDAISVASGTVFSGDTNDLDDYGYGPGMWITHPSWGIMEASCGFERHLGRIVVSYVDGHVGTFTRDEIRSAKYGGTMSNGLAGSAWLIESGPGDGCGGKLIHPIRPGPVN